jgi:hypothetical protein
MYQSLKNAVEMDNYRSESQMKKFVVKHQNNPNVNKVFQERPLRNKTPARKIVEVKSADNLIFYGIDDIKWSYDDSFDNTAGYNFIKDEFECYFQFTNKKGYNDYTHTTAELLSSAHLIIQIDKDYNKKMEEYSTRITIEVTDPVQLKYIAGYIGCIRDFNYDNQYANMHPRIDLKMEFEIPASQHLRVASTSGSSARSSSGSSVVEIKSARLTNILFDISITKNGKEETIYPISITR